jgi:hypothetical protein
MTYSIIYHLTLPNDIYLYQQPIIHILSIHLPYLFSNYPSNFAHKILNLLDLAMEIMLFTTHISIFICLYPNDRLLCHLLF